MSVLMQDTGRGDVLLIRGTTNVWAVRWEQSADGITYAPVNLSGWTGVLELRSPLEDIWLSKSVSTSVDGVTVMTVTPADLSAPAWTARSGGSWAVNLTAPDAHVERLGQGYFHLEA